MVPYLVSLSQILVIFLTNKKKKKKEKISCKFEMVPCFWVCYIFGFRSFLRLRRKTKQNKKKEEEEKTRCLAKPPPSLPARAARLLRRK